MNQPTNKLAWITQPLGIDKYYDYEQLSVKKFGIWPNKIMFVRTRYAESVQCRDFFRESLTRAVAPKQTEVTINTSLTSSVMWPFDTPWAISYTCSIVTVSVSLAVFEIIGPKHFGVTTLTFQGHVTWSITWPIDSS